MANYQYDEGSGMASYFILTVLSLILVPLTVTSFFTSTSNKSRLNVCQCSQCTEQRERVSKRSKRSLLHPRLSAKSIFLILGWSLFAFLAYKISTTRRLNKVYDPFEILGIRTGTSEGEVKSHYKKLSRKFHPDKVKLAINQTIEEVEAYFVELTKAYKSLTDETTRKNWELYGHPDGRQEVRMGIAIPKWVVEGDKKYLFLAGYCGILGLVLPTIVGKWWFGSRIKTKDGVLAKSAEMFFKSIKEDSAINDLFECLARAYELEHPNIEVALGELKEIVRSRLDGKYTGSPTQTLLYAHLLRIPIDDPLLQKAQENVFSYTPPLLTSLLNIAMSHNWLAPTLHAMRLHAYLVQAILPRRSQNNEIATLTQFPRVSEEDAKSVVERIGRKSDIQAFVDYLKESNDARASEATKAVRNWGKLELVEASFRVLGERIVTPLSIVQLLVKVRVVPIDGKTERIAEPEDPGEIKRTIKANEEKDAAFLASRRDAEELMNGLQVFNGAHMPYWPAPRKPSWWVLITDNKLNRLVMPPMRISDAPVSDPSNERNFRAYKMQFQAPQGAMLYPWKIHIVSDTFIGEEVIQDITLKVEDVSQLNADEHVAEDEISDPEEDSLAGQMALMKGGSVKRSAVHAESDDDDESGTDDDEKNNSDSSSDSD